MGGYNPSPIPAIENAFERLAKSLEQVRISGLDEVQEVLLELRKDLARMREEGEAGKKGMK